MLPQTWPLALPVACLGEKLRLLGPEPGGACMARMAGLGAARPTFTSKKADPKVGHRQIHFRKATLASSTVMSLCLSQARRMRWGKQGPVRA